MSWLKIGFRSELCSLDKAHRIDGMEAEEPEIELIFRQIQFILTTAGPVHRVFVVDLAISCKKGHFGLEDAKMWSLAREFDELTMGRVHGHVVKRFISY